MKGAWNCAFSHLRQIPASVFFALQTAMNSSIASLRVVRVAMLFV